MLRELDQLQLQLLDVLWIKEDSAVMRTKARPFYALSLRTNGNTAIVPENGGLIQLKERDLALFPPNFSYTRYSHDDNKFVFHFNLLNLQPQVHSIDKTPKIEILPDFRYDTLLPLFSEAYRIWHSHAHGRQIRCTAILYSIFAEIFENTAADPPQYTPLITEALRYLDAHYSENDTSVSLLAKHLHISTTYLRNCFLKELSVTPKAYLTSLRMTSAQSLLSTGYYSVSSVAEQVGFGDAKNFAVAYKKHFGYPPSAQRYQDFL